MKSFLSLIVAFIAAFVVILRAASGFALAQNTSANLTYGYTDMEKVQVTVSVDDAHLEQVEQVAEQLKTAGLDVEQTLFTIGVISGSVAPEQLDQLSQVAGVAAVEPDRSYQLPPPGTDIQ